VNANGLKCYRFATPAQWQSCLLQRFDLDRAAGVVAARRFGTRPFQRTQGSPDLVAAGADGRVLWRDSGSGVPLLYSIDDAGEVSAGFEPDALLARSARWCIGRRVVWAFSGCALCWYDREHLQPQRNFACAATIVDISSDECDCVWLLLRLDGSQFALSKIDREGVERARWPLPSEIERPTQLASSARGQSLALLDGSRLLLLDAASGRIERALNLNAVTSNDRVDRLTGDGRQRMLLWASNQTDAASGFQLYLLDGDGDLIDRPLATLEQGLPAVFARSPMSAAVSRDTIWLATDAGLWQLDATDDSVLREAESVLVTPALHSPDVGTERGWLRAEVEIALPAGCVLEAEIAGADTEAVVAAMTKVAVDTTLTTETKIEQLWSNPDVMLQPRLRFTGPSLPGVPLSIPLFQTSQRWLWLKLKLVSPPGTPPLLLEQVRVLYPNVSLVQHLPAIFHGEKNDPGAVLRRLVGVLETTTQSIDDKIQSIGVMLTSESAPVAWLDSMARWLDIPWDESLDPDQKRRLLLRAEDLLEQRGTAQGLELLLSCLLGSNGTARVTDLTVRFPPQRLGGTGQAGARLPALLAGASPRIARVGTKARVGQTYVVRGPLRCDPLSNFTPCIAVELWVATELRRSLEPALSSLLEQCLPASLRHTVRWYRSSKAAASAASSGMFDCDGGGPGRLGDDAVVGRTALDGLATARLTDAQSSSSFRLH
jgi:phage tail-like protein